jgi:hypothetical protein
VWREPPAVFDQLPARRSHAEVQLEDEAEHADI